MGAIKRDPVEPEPVGTVVLMAFKVTGYDPDCDGSLMARLSHIRPDGPNDEWTESGWNETNIGLYSDDIVVTEEELVELAAISKKGSPSG
jgi:hypothetical protein